LFFRSIRSPTSLHTSFPVIPNSDGIDPKPAPHRLGAQSG
jgi:hypothetical protein